jgi:hypothetical protein
MLQEKVFLKLIKIKRLETQLKSLRRQDQTLETFIILLLKHQNHCFLLSKVYLATRKRVFVIIIKILTTQKQKHMKQSITLLRLSLMFKEALEFKLKTKAKMLMIKMMFYRCNLKNKQLFRNHHK